MTNDRLHKLADRGLDEFRRFLVMFLYLWAAFGLFVLNEAVILRKTDISFLAQGFALINAAILAKVMLIAEALKLGRRFDHLPLIRAVGRQEPALDRRRHLDRRRLCLRDHDDLVAAVLRVARDRTRLLGEGRLWALMLHRRVETSSSA